MTMTAISSGLSETYPGRGGSTASGLTGAVVGAGSGVKTVSGSDSFVQPSNSTQPANTMIVRHIKPTPEVVHIAPLEPSQQKPD